MDLKIVFVFVLTTVVATESSDISRAKRSKYFPYPPPGAKIYRRAPPQPFYPKPSGAFSYTPPPNWMDDNPRQPQPPQHVSKPQGLGDEDINNLVKYLSKQDLDKIIEFAGEKERDRPREQSFVRQVEEPQNYDEEKRPLESMAKYKGEVQNQIGDYSHQSHIYTRPYNQDTSDRKFNNYRDQSSREPNQYNAEESVNYQTVYLNGPYAHHINREINTMATQDSKDSAIEEDLPKPLNLREDNEAEGTNNVAALAKPDSYEVKNFGDLPLMEYLSKLDTVSSYHVPHYSITSAHHHLSNNNYNNKPYSPTSPPVEPAPPAHFAKEQSDAHLKAIKIWTHRSKGAAYTLNNDGTLSVERPLKPKPVYGPY